MKLYDYMYMKKVTRLSEFENQIIIPLHMKNDNYWPIQYVKFS